MTGPAPEVVVTVHGDAGADDQETAVLAERLRAELRDFEFDVSGLGRETEPGAKAVDPVSISALVVALAASGGALTALVEAVQAWLLRGSARRVVLELDGDRLELDGVTSQERRMLTAEWLARLPLPDPGDPDDGDPDDGV